MIIEQIAIAQWGDVLFVRDAADDETRFSLLRQIVDQAKTHSSPFDPASNATRSLTLVAVPSLQLTQPSTTTAYTASYLILRFPYGTQIDWRVFTFGVHEARTGMIRRPVHVIVFDGQNPPRGISGVVNEIGTWAGNQLP